MCTSQKNIKRDTLIEKDRLLAIQVALIEKDRLLVIQVALI
jgi:hypothetical protein